MTRPAFLSFCLSALLIVLSSLAAHAQTTNSGSSGIPIDDPLIISKCAGCHTRNSQGMMGRLSYIRTSPEVWEQAVKRMVRLNGLVLTPEEARHVVRYLSNNNGLSPEEARPAFWDAEHRLFRTQEEEAGVAPELQRTCNYCHTIGRVLSQRRTGEDYEKLANTHMALFPGSETSVFKPNPRYNNPQDQPVGLSQAGVGFGVLTYPAETPADSAGNSTQGDHKYPIDVALAYLRKNQPLVTPEWSAWKSRMTMPKLAGKWLLTAYQPGKGKVFGEVTICATAEADDFTTKSVLHFADGRTMSLDGKGVVYTGYSWRGHAVASQKPADSDPSTPAETREAMLLSDDGNSLEGRWFWGGYQEFGIDVKLMRVERAPVVLGFDLYSVQSPSTAELHVYGGNLPRDIKPDDFDLGAGVSVAKVLQASPTEITLQISVASGLTSSRHSVSLRGIVAPQDLVVYDKIDYIKVSPDANFARLGGTITAKQFAQFQTIGYSNGPDHIADTKDDISLGPVKSEWSLEEFYSTPADDDVKYVGTIDQSGLFTPALEGPNPNRKKQTNNYPTENWGDVWVDASFDTADGKSLKARSYLVVTIPTYIRYDQPEVGQ
jgi:quinohemoprotein amine dehydrogenase